MKSICWSKKQKLYEHFLFNLSGTSFCLAMCANLMFFESVLCIINIKYLQGYLKVFRHLKCDICGWLVHLKKKWRKLQILIGIIPTFSEDFIQIDKVWPQLQPKTWSEAILRIYTSLDHFIIDSLQECILEATIDCQEIQCWLKGDIVPKWMSSVSMAASRMHFWNCWW